jgi:hypothetical protein
LNILRAVRYPIYRHRTRRQVLTAAACLGLAIACGGKPILAQESPGAATIDTVLAAPTKTMTYSFLPRSQATSPVFSHGYFIQFKHRVSNVGESNVYLFNSYGALERQIAVGPEGATTLFLTSVDLGQDGQVVFAGEATKGDGGTLRFIAISNRDGVNTKCFSTGDYRASQIAVADDGSIWSLGSERGRPYQAAGVSGLKWPNYDMLRHYSTTGGLLEHFLPRFVPAEIAYITDVHGPTGQDILAAHDVTGTILAQYPPDSDAGYGEGWKPSRQTFLKSAGSQTVLYDGLRDRVCVYNATAGRLTCANVRDQYVGEMSVTGLAISARGDILGSLLSGEFGPHALHGLFVLKQPSGSANAQWQIIRGTRNTNLAEGDFLKLLGSDGGSIVYSHRGSAGGSLSTVSESTW